MSLIKIITVLNWGLIIVFGAVTVWAFLQESKPSHEMPGVESIIKGVMILVLAAAIGMNASSHSWMKVVALIFLVLVLLIVRQIATN